MILAVSFEYQPPLLHNFLLRFRRVAAENPLSLSWHDSAWVPMVTATNVLDYFSERSNPFYDRTCNNEIIKMQRLNPDQLV